MSALETILEGFGDLTKSKIMRMFECEALEDFLVGLSNLVSLEVLYFGTWWALKTIPECFGDLTKLKTFRMFECEALELVGG